jgi:hypothetical protein
MYLSLICGEKNVNKKIGGKKSILHLWVWGTISVLYNGMGNPWHALCNFCEMLTHFLEYSGINVSWFLLTCKMMNFEYVES